jgi:hypothetical protein
MRYLALVVSLLAAAACGGDNVTAPAPTNGPVYFRIDGVSCRGGDAITLYIDGAPVGTETLVAGGSSSGPYMAAIGQHGLGAKEVNSPFYTWPTSVAYVPAGGYTMLLTCN